MAQWDSQQFHLHIAWKYKRDCTHAASVLRFAWCGLRHTLTQAAAEAAAEAAADAAAEAQRRPHGYSCIVTLNRVHLNNFTKHESEIAGNSL